MEVLQHDIVIAAGLQLGKTEALALGAEMADVDQLRVALVVAAGQNIRQRVGGIQRGQAGAIPN